MVTISLDPLILKVSNFVDDDFASIILKEAKYSGNKNVTRFQAPSINDYVLSSAKGRLAKIQPFELNVSKLINLPISYQKYLQVTCVKEDYISTIYSHRSFAFDKKEGLARAKIRVDAQNPVNTHFATLLLFPEGLPPNGAGAIIFKPSSSGSFDCKKPNKHIIGKIYITYLYFI